MEADKVESQGAVAGQVERSVRPRVSGLMECPECGWQGQSIECDGTYCPTCGAEAFPRSAFYNEDGTPKEA